MCTVTLSYDKNNVLAQQQLATLLSTGLFKTYEDEGGYDLQIPTDRNLSLEELESLVVKGIKTICKEKDEVHI